MEHLFICASEAKAFAILRPEYNIYGLVLDKYGDIAGYNVSIEEETQKCQLND